MTRFTSRETTRRNRRAAQAVGARKRLLALLAVLALLLAACGSDFDDTDAGEEASGASADFETEDGGGFDEAVEDDGDFAIEEAEAMEEEAMADEGEAEQASAEPPSDDVATDGESASGQLGAGGAAVTPTAADLGRKLIFTARVEVGVDDVAAASAEATSIIEGMGGFLFGQNTVGGNQPRSELTFKVLPDDFNRALEALGTVGELRNQSVTTDDVTERIVDLESRIQVAELGVERLRTSLETTTDLDDFAQVERLLLERESDLEVMRGQLRTLQDRVDLATITLIVSQDRVENGINLFISSYEGHDGGESCPGQESTRIEEGAEATVCFDIINVGDQTLTDIALTDTVLGIDGQTQLIEVFGTLDELAPGQSVLVAHEINPERTQRLRTRVIAVPTDGVSAEPAGPTVSTQVGFEIRTFEPEGDPGFGDGFSVALDFLGALWVGFKVIVGFLIPMLILLPFVWLLWWGVREFRKRRPPRQRGGGYRPGPGLTPPPPPPAPSSTTPSSSPPPPAGAGEGQEVAVGAGTVSDTEGGDADSGE